MALLVPEQPDLFGWAADPTCTEIIRFRSSKGSTSVVFEELDPATETMHRCDQRSGHPRRHRSGGVAWARNARTDLCAPSDDDVAYRTARASR